MFKSLDSIASVVGIFMYLTISKFKQVQRSRLQHWPLLLYCTHVCITRILVLVEEVLEYKENECFDAECLVPPHSYGSDRTFGDILGDLYPSYTL